jgi:uncharacterized ion transporter superfamily protein YfcC
MIKSVAKAHTHSAFVRAMLIPVFVTMFSLGGATFGMSEEAIPFILIFVPLALALGYDSVVGVAIPFVGSQVGFAAAFLNPFNVGVAQGIAGVEVFSGMGYRIVWAAGHRHHDRLPDVVRGAHQARARAQPDLRARPRETQGTCGRLRRLYRHDPHPRRGAGHLPRLHGAMVVGVVAFGWYINEIAALFLVMGIVVGIVGRLDADQFVAAFLQGAKDLVTTGAGDRAGARHHDPGARRPHHRHHAACLMPLVQSSSPVFAAQKMFLIQSVINFFIHSGTGQAALTMPIMAPLADLVGVTRQTAILAYQFGEFTTPMIPTSGITVGVLALARIPWITWARWMVPLQLMYFVLAMLLLIPPCLMHW